MFSQIIVNSDTSIGLNGRLEVVLQWRRKCSPFCLGKASASYSVVLVPQTQDADLLFCGATSCLGFPMKAAKERAGGRAGTGGRAREGWGGEGSGGGAVAPRGLSLTWHNDVKQRWIHRKVRIYGT